MTGIRRGLCYFPPSCLSFPSKETQWRIQVRVMERQGGGGKPWRGMEGPDCHCDCAKERTEDRQGSKHRCRHRLCRSPAAGPSGRQAELGLPCSIHGPPHRHRRGDPVPRTHGAAALPCSPRCQDTLGPAALGLCSLLCSPECNRQANEHPPHGGLGQGQHVPPALSTQQSLPHTQPAPSSPPQPVMDPTAARLGDSQHSVAPCRAGPRATGSHLPHPEQMPALRPPCPQG